MPDPKPLSAPIRYGLIVLTGLCLVGLFSTEVADTDFWWHLKTGEYIWQTRSLPVPDPFAYTTDLGTPAYRGEEKVRYFNLTHEWLAQVLWYLIYRVAGFPGVVLFKALLLAGFCGIAGVVAVRRSGEFYWGFAAAGAAASVAYLFSADRPALITFLLVAAFVWVLERGSPLWLLPVLSLVWANCHGGYFLGWVILGAYVVGAGFSRRLALITLASVAVSGINPNSFRIFEILPAYRQSYLMQSLIEWTKPNLWGPPYAFNIMLYAAAAVMILAWRRVRASDWLLFLAFAGASLMAFRNIMLVAFLAPILVASYFPWCRTLPSAAAPLIAVGLVVLLGAGVLQGRFFQLRAALWKFPSGAADFILARGLSEPIFNTYEYGGYLLWRLGPRQRVFIDGRALNESVYRDYQNVIGSAGSTPAESRQIRQQVLERYKIGVIVANAFEYTTGVVYPLVLALANPAQNDWQLVYQDPQALVFLRHPPADTPVLDKSHVAGHLESECRTHIEKDSELCLCARTLGFLFAQTGDASRARRSFELYFASPHDPDPEAEGAYRRLVR